MSITKLLQEQSALVNECKQNIESSKLKLWSYRAELGALQDQYSNHNSLIQGVETPYSALLAGSRDSLKQAKLTIETINEFQFASLLRVASPSPVVQDVAGSICLMLGFSTGSWPRFRKLLKQFHETHQAMKNFTVDYIELGREDCIGHTLRRHSISLMIKDAKFPEEFLGFAS